MQGHAMHFVVTGARGFIGRHFAGHLLARGHRVTAVTREGGGATHPAITAIGGGVEELTQRRDILENADAVCHLAWGSIPASSFADPLAAIDRDLRPTVALLEAMRRHGNGRILFLSSGGAVYGPPLTAVIAEDHPTQPISPYGVGKLAVERFLHCFAEAGELSPVVIRPANPYGPDQGKLGQLGAVWTFLQKALAGEAATMFGDGSVVRDFVHVDDLCRLMVAAAESAQQGVFNCGGGGEGTSLRDLALIIEQATGRPLRIDHRPERPFDPPRIVLDIAKARDSFGWTPQIPLAEGVSQLVSPSSLEG